MPVLGSPIRRNGMGAIRYYYSSLWKIMKKMAHVFDDLRPVLMCACIVLYNMGKLCSPCTNVGYGFTNCVDYLLTINLNNTLYITYVHTINTGISTRIITKELGHLPGHGPR